MYGSAIRSMLIVAFSRRPQYDFQGVFTSILAIVFGDTEKILLNFSFGEDSFLSKTIFDNFNLDSGIQFGKGKDIKDLISKLPKELFFTTSSERNSKEFDRLIGITRDSVKGFLLLVIEDFLFCLIWSFWGCKSLKLRDVVEFATKFEHALPAANSLPTGNTKF